MPERMDSRRESEIQEKKCIYISFLFYFIFIFFYFFFINRQRPKFHYRGVDAHQRQGKKSEKSEEKEKDQRTALG